MVPNLLGNWALKCSCFLSTAFCAAFRRSHASSETAQSFAGASLRDERLESLSPSKQAVHARFARLFAPVRLKLWTWKELTRKQTKKCQKEAKNRLKINFLISSKSKTFKTSIRVTKFSTKKLDFPEFGQKPATKISRRLFTVVHTVLKIPEINHRLVN